MRVRAAGLRHVGAPGDDVTGVVPVGGFRHIGLFAPGHRRSGWQITVPVVEAQAGAAQQRQITGARRVRDHRHRRNRGETRDAVRAVGFDGPDVGGGNQLIQLLPAGADKSAASAHFFVAGGFLRVGHDRRPGLYRIAVLCQRLAPQFNQTLAHQRILQPVSAVEIPGVAGPTRAAPRLVVRQVGAGARIVGLLRFPGNQPVLDVDLPATGTGTVNAVCGAHHFVVLPALAIAVLPVTVGVHHLAVIVGEGIAFKFEITEPVEKFAHCVLLTGRSLPVVALPLPECPLQRVDGYFFSRPRRPYTSHVTSTQTT